MPTFPPTETVISGLSIDRNFPTLKKFFLYTTKCLISLLKENIQDSRKGGNGNKWMKSTEAESNNNSWGKLEN